MAIFYCGKVNVYDDVPRDKVMKLHYCCRPFDNSLIIVA